MRPDPGTQACRNSVGIRPGFTSPCPPPVVTASISTCGHPTSAAKPRSSCGSTAEPHATATAPPARSIGASLARRGNVVVVTVNYRLGALGGLAHPDLVDPATGTCANWGLQDKIAALRWIQECAQAFGGDARNVTIAGQSSGAMNVALMAQNADLDGLFHRAIMQSPPLFQPPMFAELAEAAEYTEALAESPSNVRLLS